MGGNDTTGTLSSARSRSLVSGWRTATLGCTRLLPAVAALLVVLPPIHAQAAPRWMMSRSPSLSVVVAENFWGSIARQEAGNRAHVSSIITNPNADPHSYEPTVTDARLMENARYVILNGAGYDAWGQKLLSANPVAGRRVLVIGDLLGKKQGDNPHLWYGPEYVARAAAQVTADFKRLDPHDAGYFDHLHALFMNSALRQYHSLIASIGRSYHGVPVGSTESIFVYLDQALKLKLITPPSFMKAISDGTSPTAQDKATFDRQIARKEIKVLVFNSQNATPDTKALQERAARAHIPVVAITETLVPATASFQGWQVGELQSLQRALKRATGR